MKTGDTIIHKEDPEKIGIVEFQMGNRTELEYIDPKTCLRTGEKEKVSSHEWRVLIKGERKNKFKKEGHA